MESYYHLSGLLLGYQIFIELGGGVIRRESLSVRSWVVSLQYSVQCLCLWSGLFAGAQPSPASSVVGVGAFDPLAIWLKMQLAHF